MNRTNFGHRSGIVIDVCKSHGVWLEHNELRRVLNFIDSGGLERSRAMDRDHADAQRELARLLRERGGPGPVSVHTTSVHLRFTNEQPSSLLDEALQILFS
jgi:Zn-finger nucleic acid-binding protein